MMLYFPKKIQNFFIFVLLVSLTAAFGSYFSISEFKNLEKEILPASLSKKSFPETKEKPTILMFVGDIMLDRGVEYMIKTQGNGDFRFPFRKIVDDLKGAKLLLGNLEGPISDKGQKVGSIYSFRANPKAIEGLVYAGFDILSVANNHIFDYGREAMEDTFKGLKDYNPPTTLPLAFGERAPAEIDYVGGGFSEKEARSPVIREVNGTKIAFLAYTNLGSKQWQAKENSSGIAWLDERIEEDIKEAKEKSAIVVVSMHLGEEYQFEPSPEQKYFAHLSIDSGADLVIGHHPHVIQPIEKYKEGYIAYSLGNFVFDQGFSEQTMQGLLLKVLVKGDRIKEVIPINIKINQYFQPEINEK